MKNVKDIDILVSDEDFKSIRKYLTANPRNIRKQVDVNTVTGSQNADYGGIAYMPPHLSSQVLLNRIKNKDGIFIPCDRDYFLSLSFHALYHKGFASWLESVKNKNNYIQNGKYHQKLMEIKNKIGIDAQLNMESLDLLLENEGWRPTIDSLSKWAGRNLWLELTLLNEHTVPNYPIPQSLISFFVREETSDEKSIEIIKRIFAEENIHITHIIELNIEQQKRVLTLTRGANWPKEDGGSPVMLMIAIDLACDEWFGLPVWIKRIRKVKERIRKEINQGRRKSPLGVLHSSDGVLNAVSYMEIVFGIDAERIVTQVELYKKSLH